MTQIEKLIEHVEILGQVMCSICQITGTVNLDEHDDGSEMETQAAADLFSRGWRTEGPRVLCFDCSRSRIPAP